MSLLDRVMLVEAVKLTKVQHAVLGQLVAAFGTDEFLWDAMQQGGGRASTQKGGKKRKHVGGFARSVDPLARKGLLARVPKPTDSLLPHEKGYTRFVTLRVTDKGKEAVA